MPRRPRKKKLDMTKSELRKHEQTEYQRLCAARTAKSTKGRKMNEPKTARAHKIGRALNLLEAAGLDVAVHYYPEGQQDYADAWEALRCADYFEIRASPKDDAEAGPTAHTAGKEKGNQ
jgi:hypothetical protein